MCRSPVSDAWTGPAALLARAQLRRQGLAEPLREPVLVLVEFGITHPRDWDNGLKDACDALNGIAWDDDRRIVAGAGVLIRAPRRNTAWLVARLATEASAWTRILHASIASGVRATSVLAASVP